ncbi:MAG: hypothetical protein A3I61_19830 [Acidobacteria bacterium RIFCSPLOWO2_02_FULL_68_18]|nr:MAG: hypothetical protein A3I61_19830 [Acidobacteria bacterium RIFCSPLOWO2_02_FULL_68_18]OFW48286.1 MAG: hypothetical protein A3G77_03305 [Acidobacteria bacterium RIFCSPLOWO2_12_FULL_68_19]
MRPPSSVTQDDAIRLHEAQAPLFRERYRAQETDPYSSAFNYGRKKIGETIVAALGTDGRGRMVLDAGCGTGFFLRALEARNFRVTGIDLAWEMLSRAREDTGARIVFGDVAVLPFPPATFDAVVSVEVVRYLREPERAIVEYRRVLRPGGICVITAASWLSSHGYAFANRVNAALHVTSRIKARQSFETTWTLRNKMIRAGLEDVSVEARFLGPFVLVEKCFPRLTPRWLRRWEPLDDRVADAYGFRNLSNHLIAVGRKPSLGGRA